MQMIKIKIPDQDDCAKGFAAMMRRGRVECLKDNSFIVPEPALALLHNLGISFMELGRGGMDYAQKEIRDSVAAQS